uniref:Uncharacterized protein n=1 Tax=Cuerna arida TaxID=1464854 RepID=A0A1B6FWZ6_9HEMI
MANPQLPISSVLSLRGSDMTIKPLIWFVSAHAYLIIQYLCESLLFIDLCGSASKTTHGSESSSDYYLMAVMTLWLFTYSEQFMPSFMAYVWRGFSVPTIVTRGIG